MNKSLSTFIEHSKPLNPEREYLERGRTPGDAYRLAMRYFRIYGRPTRCECKVCEKYTQNARKAVWS